MSKNRYTVKKTFTIGVKIGTRLSKRLAYTNPYSHDLRLTLHTDSPEMLHLPKLFHKIGPGEQVRSSPANPTGPPSCWGVGCSVGGQPFPSGVLS